MECQSIDSAEAYLAKHRIDSLFADLCASLAFHQPENIREFLCKELNSRSEQGSLKGLLNSRKELDAVFNMADLLDTSKITAEQARLALLSLANSQKQDQDIRACTDIPAEVTRGGFISLATKVLEIKD